MRKSNFGVIILVLTGLGLILYQPIINYVISPKQLEKAYDTELSSEDMRDNLERLRGTEGMFDYDSVETLNKMDVNPIIKRANIIGGVYVPSVGLRMPIMYGVNNVTLRTSAGTMKPEQEMGKGNYVLIGHNARNPNVLFAPIRRIQQGESIYVSDKQKVYEYRMVDSKVVQPTQVDVMEDVEGKELVTLISCYSKDGSDRIVVTGELIGVVDYEKAASQLQNIF